VWDEPLQAGSLTVDDLVFGGSAFTNNHLLKFVDNGYWQEVTMAVEGQYVQGTLQLGVGAGAAYDVWGNPSAASGLTPVCTIAEYALGNGDVNGDGRINVADVTMLGNFIVNGTLLP
jgi:hypothetical protein